MKIIITDVVRHDGEDVEPGTAIDMPDHQAQALIDAHAAEPYGKKSKVEKDDQVEK